MVASPIFVKRGPKGYGMILKSIRVYIGDTNDYRIHHIIEVCACVCVCVCACACGCACACVCVCVCV